MLLALLQPGCDLDEDYDHSPPAGFGTLYVDNNSPDDLNVYIGGAAMAGVGHHDTRYYDLEPGVYRVVLDDADDSDRSFHDEVDILEGRRTILDVSLSAANFRRYNVLVFLDE